MILDHLAELGLVFKPELAFERILFAAFAFHDDLQAHMEALVFCLPKIQQDRWREWQPPLADATADGFAFAAALDREAMDLPGVGGGIIGCSTGVDGQRVSAGTRACGRSPACRKVVAQLFFASEMLELVGEVHQIFLSLRLIVRVKKVKRMRTFGFIPDKTFSLFSDMKIFSSAKDISLFFDLEQSKERSDLEDSASNKA